MSRRTAAWLAWSLWTVTLALVAGGLLLGVANRPQAPLYEYWLESTLINPTFATLGAVIISRRPENVIGWLFGVSSIAGGIQMFSGQYATVALLSEEISRLPGGAVAGWLSTVAQQSLVAPILFLLLLFPTGRLLSPRWRLFALCAGTVFVVWVISEALRPGPLEEFAPTPNPFGVAAAAAVLDLLDNIGGWMSFACFVGAILSLILRFYRSRGEERLQLKWFAYAAVLGFLAILFGSVLVPASFDDRFGTLVWTVAPLGLPVSAGIAILRYRLYDIDVLINRTLVYGALTALLVAVYVGSIVVLQGLVRALTAQESQLAIVASTLAVAALFNPLRRRIQGFIDRRFYRSKYDARKTLEDFSARLRDETDLDALNDHLIGLVSRTMQPAHVSLWLRPDPGSEQKRREMEP
jgi:hypothetical protein